jgi:hypothetical protein
MTDPRSPSEFQIHCGVADALRMLARPDVLWSHFPSGESRDARTGAKLKHMGLQPGWPDFIIIVPGDPWDLHRPQVCCFLELKTIRGRLSPSQQEFRDNAVAVGCLHSVARSVDEAVEVLSRWGAIRRAESGRDEDRRERVA